MMEDQNEEPVYIELNPKAVRAAKAFANELKYCFGLTWAWLLARTVWFALSESMHIKRSDWSKNPNPTIWCASGTGSLAYQGVWAARADGSCYTADAPKAFK